MFCLLYAMFSWKDIVFGFLNSYLWLITFSSSIDGSNCMNGTSFRFVFISSSSKNLTKRKKMKVFMVVCCLATQSTCWYLAYIYSSSCPNLSSSPELPGLVVLLLDWSSRLLS
ncbi:unnamed protein product [Brassica rapa]|uniref:Uncharacterized protein n=1 Tax=Brassica campestris TaxID=3711 RepID=A0A8D9GLU1_BRACM|nr:unnamed protein product [Brassica rapa]